MKRPRKKTPAIKKKLSVKKKIPFRDIRTSYLDMIYEVEEFVRLVPKAVRSVKKFHSKTPFDAIAFTGCSGAAIAYPLSYKLKIPLICIRKKGFNGNCHYDQPLEGFIGAKRYLIVDDFIGTGSTIKKIISTIKSYGKVKNKTPKLVGIFLYDKSCIRTKYLNVPLFGL